MKDHKIFAEHIEGKALAQFYSALAEDFAVKGALMPDTHTGYSLPIGGVIATKGVIVPAWVGFDVGCGVGALKTSLKREQVQFYAKEIHQRILNRIPVGQNKHKHPKNFKNVTKLTELGQEVYYKRNSQYQLGTLGGGNHFIEVGYDQDDNVWITCHSGSRGLGHGLATEYMKIASDSNKAREGHYGLDEYSCQGKAYINDMNIALEYALENRMRMILNTFDVMQSLDPGSSAAVNELINRNHNHAEKRDGLWIHRKGATHAEEGMMGVIPGNMRDGAFIVRGKGCEDSLYSSSHGAGRVLSRGKAKDTLDVDEFKKSMEGIVSQAGKSTLDESPEAYKNIFEVMELQKDLVEVVAHVKPILNVKG